MHNEMYIGDFLTQTSNGILWSLYCLGRNMDAQEILYQETLTLLPNPDDQITKEVFTELKYVRACLKEALRFKIPIE